MDTTTSSQETAAPDSPGRRHQAHQPQQPPSDAAGAAGTLLGSSAVADTGLSQVMSRFDASLAEVRTAQAATQLEVLRALERLDLMEHAALRDRLDDLDARLHRERHRREAGEAALQKAVTSILRSLNRADIGDSLELLNELRSGDIAAVPSRARSGQDGGLLVSHGLLSSGPAESSATSAAAAAAGRHSASSEKLRGSSPLRGNWGERLSLGAGQETAATATRPEASAVGAASSAREAYWPPTAGLAAASAQPGATDATLPLAREAYEELFAKKARCFEQAVNMIEATAASVTKRLEVVLAESSAAMRQEASDRAAAMSEIQRALQELRDTPDRPQREQSTGLQAPLAGGSGGQHNAAGRPQGSSANAPATAPQQVAAAFNRRSLATNTASPNAAPGSGTGVGGKGAAVGGAGANKAKEEGASTAPVQSPLPVSNAPEQRQTIARCGSESSALMGLTAPHKALPVSSPVSASATGSPPSSTAGGGGTSMAGPGVVRASSQPQHVQFDVAGGPSEAIIMSAKDADLSPIAEQQGSNTSPRKHVVLAPKTLTASNLGGSALFRQQAESASIGRLMTKPGSTMPAQSPDSGPSPQQPNVQQTGLIAATPRPSAAQPTGVQAYNSVNGVKSGMTQPHSSQVHPQQTPSRAVGPPVGWVSQQQAAGPGSRPGDATPVMRPGSVPPGTRMPGRSVTTAAAVMRFTSK